MYYVVRLAGIKGQEKHHVFPVKWMRNSEIQLEKFIQNRINKNQVHIFFWSNAKKDNGEPDTDVQPNFELPIQNSFPPSTVGCFHGQPIHFFCNYVAAVAYKNGLRSVSPPLYNVRRLQEEPLPDLNQNVHDSSSKNDSFDHEDAHNNAEASLSNNEVEQSGHDTVENNNVEINSSNSQVEQSEDDTVSFLDQLFASHSSISDTNDNENPIDNEFHADIKTELHFNQRADLDEITSIFNAEKDDSEVAGAGGTHDSESENEIEFVIINDNFPQPVQYSIDGLLKREDDPISGNLAYADAPQV